VASPLEQFEIHALAPINIGGLNLSFTNSALFMVSAACIASAVIILGMRKQALVPSRFQSVAEMLYEVVANMVRDNVGDEGKRYFPFFFTLFLFVLFGNLIGLGPYTFTFTSHIVVTFAMALTIFVSVTIIGMVRHGFHFASFFFPAGAPAWMAVILVPIELISYLSRPLSLSVRLFANMTVGHVILKVLGGFVVMLAVFGFVPLLFLIGISALELLVAVLQAYIFTILSCIYLHDALHLH